MRHPFDHWHCYSKKPEVKTSPNMSSLLTPASVTPVVGVTQPCRFAQQSDALTM
jgi:hypothetical protein